MSRRIQDEFTDLPITRQQKWQLRRSRDGKCQQCGEKIDRGRKGHCLNCLLHRLETRRKRDGAKKRYRSLTWKLKNGK